MALVTNAKILNKAYKNKYAVGAFNFSTMEIFHGITRAALKLKSPIILASSKGELSFFGAEYMAAVAEKFSNIAKIPVSMHLDHGPDFETVKQCIKAGYSSVHIDNSSLPMKDNIRNTKKAVNYAHKKGISVEGEIGHVAGSSKLNKQEINIDKDLLTRLEDAVEYVEKTGVDMLAVAIGNAHGVYKSSPKLDFKILHEISKKIKIPLVLHGGSGISNQQIRKAVSLGIAKVNVNTENRIAFADKVRENLKQSPKEIVPYKMFKDCSLAVQKIVEKKIKLFGSVNKA